MKTNGQCSLEMATHDCSRFLRHFPSCRYHYSPDLTSFTPTGYNYTPQTTTSTIPFEITPDYVVDSTTFGDVRQTSLDPLPDSGAMSPVVSSGKCLECHPLRAESFPTLSLEGPVFCLSSEERPLSRVEFTDIWSHNVILKSYCYGSIMLIGQVL